MVGSFNGISTTCKLEMDFFFRNSEISTVKSHVSHVYVTQLSLNDPFA